MNVKPFFICCALLYAILLTASCANITNVNSKDLPVEIYETESRFMQDYNALQNPKGIMPTILTIGKGNPDIILKMPNNYFEYFAFDSDTSLIILSQSPFSYIKIKSRTIANHLLAEYNQFYANVYLSPSEKQVSAKPCFEKIGDCEISVQFTPSEVFFGTEDADLNKIVDVDDTSTDHLSDVLASKDFALIYTPDLLNENFYSTLSSQMQSDYYRYIYVTSSTFYPPIFEKITQNLSYSFVYCSALIPNGDGLYQNREAEDDYCYLLSAPLGDTSNDDSASISSAHGIMVTLKGNLFRFKTYFQKKGFDFNNQPTPTNELFLTETSGAGDETASVTLKWTNPDKLFDSDGDGNNIDVDDRTFRLSYRQTVKNPLDYPSAYSTWVSFENDCEDESYELTGLERGYCYEFRISDNSSGKIYTKTIILAKDPSIETIIDDDEDTGTGEITGELAITEINLKGSIQEVTTSSGALAYRNRPDRWIEIKNISDKVIRLDNINFYHMIINQTASDNLSGGEILCGPASGQSGMYAPISADLYAGDYYIVSNSLDYLFSEMLIDKISCRNIPTYLSSTPSDPLDPATGYQVVMAIGNLIIATSGANYGFLNTDSATQELICGSNVYGVTIENKWGWIISKNYFMYVNPNSSFGTVTLCSPGMSAEGEY